MTRDLRKYAGQTTTRLILGGLALLFILGDGLIYLIYGREAAILGLICLIGGLAPLVIVWLALLLIGWLARRADEG
jgi:TM2 domain-containing membrane protein YozV